MIWANICDECGTTVRVTAEGICAWCLEEAESFPSYPDCPECGPGAEVKPAGNLVCRFYWRCELGHEFVTYEN